MRGAILTFACVLAAVPPVHAQEVTRPETGPYDITLLPGPDTPEVSGHARLVFADSPFGVAVTVDGHAIYDVELTAEGLPPASELGAYSSYVAWAVTPDLGQWVRLGPVANGTTTVGPVQLDKFMIVVTAESTAGDRTQRTSRGMRATSPTEHSGPTVLHGRSPSSWLQSFLTHPLFRGVR